MGFRTKAGHRPSLALVGLLAATFGCASRVDSGAPGTAVGAATFAATVQGAPGVTRVVLTVSAGDGPSFSPMVVELQQSGGSWAAQVKPVPVGPGRLFSAAALDATGVTVLSGSAKVDVVPGMTAVVTILLGGAPPQPFQNSLPAIQSLTVPLDPVPIGSTVSLRLAASDPDGDPVTRLWQASCGSLSPSPPTSSQVAWTAPAVGPTTCALSVSVSDGRGITLHLPFDIVVTTTRPVKGTRLVTSWPDPPATTVSRPAPDVVSGIPPVALSRDAGGSWITSAGGFVRADGTFVASQFAPDGSFVIPAASVLPYTLCFTLSGATVCTDTTADAIDLGYDALGRPDLASPSSPTPVTLTLSNLEMWNPPTDQIQLTSSGADVSDPITPPFRVGDTGGTVVEDWSRPAAGAPLHLLAPVDALFVHQLSAQTSTLGTRIVYYSAATRATSGALTGIALASGQGATASANLAPLALSASLPIQWATGEFERHQTAMAPSARAALGPEPHALVVAANAHSLDYPAPSAAGAPELLSLALPSGLGDVATTLYYGRFLPALWLEWCGARFAAEVSYLAPGATTALVDEAWIERRDPLPTQAGPIVPAVSPVLAPQIDGQDALSARSGPVSATPTLSWSAPAVGAPTAYVVEVYQLLARGTSTERNRVLRYTTKALQVTVPPGLLEGGATYYARISALITTVPYDVAPFRWANVYALADVLTEPFTP
jgi:hypothetical protein